MIDCPFVASRSYALILPGTFLELSPLATSAGIAWLINCVVTSSARSCHYYLLDDRFCGFHNTSTNISFETPDSIYNVLVLSQR